jgi:hypothetical protein
VRVLKVSSRDLLFALENRVPGTTHYLDTESGEVVPVFSYNRDKILSDIRAAPGRFVRLAPQSGRDGYKAMEDFARTVPAEWLRLKLEAALKGPNVFRQFRDAIKEDGTEWPRWQQFHRDGIIRHLREKLVADGISLNLLRDRD